MSRVRVAVLMGGTSREREVSLTSGRMILAALDREKYDVLAFDTGEGSDQLERAPAAQTLRLVQWLTREQPDVVFLALHGRGGEDGAMQGLLELMGLPYIGSGVLASALAIDKTQTKWLLEKEGVPVIPGFTVGRGPGGWTVNGEPSSSVSEARQMLAGEAKRLGFPATPLFVKPNAEGSSVGSAKAIQLEQLNEAVERALQFDDRALVEQCIEGMEITVGILETLAGEREALPVVEIVPKSAYYDYESKYAEGGSEHIIPARLSPELTRRAQEFGIRSHMRLGCRGMSRVDMIVAGDDLFVLEVNTLPGMTPTSLLPQAADVAGIAFPALLDRLIALARREPAPRIYADQG